MRARLAALLKRIPRVYRHPQTRALVFCTHPRWSPCQYKSKAGGCVTTCLVCGYTVYCQC